jgi:hypothetical protein
MGMTRNPAKTVGLEENPAGILSASLEREGGDTVMVL